MTFTHTTVPPAPAFMLAQAPQILTVPDIGGSGEHHWQAAWESVDPTMKRVEYADFSRPDRNKWVNRLNLAIERANGPVVIAAHGAGCHVLAWWAHYTQPAWAEPVLGALLVAPPQVELPFNDPRMKVLAPTPLAPLPFPSILVASRNDPSASFDQSERLAAFWGSEFVDAGYKGHIEDGADGWNEGRALLARLANSTREAIDLHCATMQASALSLFA